MMSRHGRTTATVSRCRRSTGAADSGGSSLIVAVDGHPARLGNAALALARSPQLGGEQLSLAISEIADPLRSADLVASEELRDLHAPPLPLTHQQIH